MNTTLKLTDNEIEILKIATEENPYPVEDIKYHTWNQGFLNGFHRAKNRVQSALHNFCDNLPL